MLHFLYEYMCPNGCVLLCIMQFLSDFVWPCSYMNTEQYEEAVRDYEKVYQTEKTSGELLLYYIFAFLLVLTDAPAMSDFHTLTFYHFRSQASAEDGTAGAEEEQEERLLQGAGGRQERHRGRDQKGLSQTGPHAPPR